MSSDPSRRPVWPPPLLAGVAAPAAELAAASPAPASTRVSRPQVGDETISVVQGRLRRAAATARAIERSCPARTRSCRGTTSATASSAGSRPVSRGAPARRRRTAWSRARVDHARSPTRQTRSPRCPRTSSRRSSSVEAVHGVPQRRRAGRRREGPRGAGHDRREPPGRGQGRPGGVREVARPRTT